MKILKRVIGVVLTVTITFALAGPTNAFAATSPTLGETGAYSVLGATTVTNTGSTTVNGAVGVSAGTAITGFPPGTAGGGIHSNDASAIAAQADNLSVFGTLNQTCTNSYGSGQDLTLISPLSPGVYCSAGSFLLTGNLTLSGSGVWIFKTVSTVITSPGSSITGGDPCTVWWRVGSSATLDTTTSFVGNIFALTSISLNTGASLNGRALAQTGAVTLQGNSITSSCLSGSTVNSGGSSSPSSGNSGTTVCPVFQAIPPVIISSKRIDADSISISWGPFSGINTFVVSYGLTNGNFSYSTNVTGFSTTLNNLPANQPIWVRVAATNGCSVGTYGTATLVGGGGTVVNSSRIAESPVLPNAGFAPRNNYTLWYILTCLAVLTTASVGVVLKKRTK